MAAAKPSARETTDARAFLAALGAPDTPQMEAAVVSWMRAESGPGGNSYGNPLNIAGSSGTCGTVQVKVKGGTRTFARYCTESDGMVAAAQRLQASYGKVYGYPAIVTAARGGNPLTFLDAVALSGWVNGTAGPGYGYKVTNGIPTSHLRSIFSSLGGSVTGPGGIVQATQASTTTGGSGAPAFTADQWNAVIACFEANGAIRSISAADLPRLQSCAAAQGVSLAAVDLGSFVGKSPSDLRDALAAAGTIPGASATGGLDLNPLDALGSVAAVFGTIARFIGNPQNWLRLGALGVGTVMIVAGSKILWEAT